MRQIAWTTGCFALLIWSSTARCEEPAAEGKPAPDFELKASDGKTYKLSDFKGKQAVVIAWFPKAFTGGCTKECESMRDNGKELKGLGVAYFTASVDPVDVNAKFAESLKLDYPILSDPGRSTANAYGLLKGSNSLAARWTFYIDKEGVVRHIDKSVSTQTHGADIAKKVKELNLAK